MSHRDGNEGAATPAQVAAGRRWKARRDRWAPHTTAQAEADFDRAEAANENEQTRNR